MNERMLFDLADFYKVFGDSTRVRILVELLNGEQNVSELVDKLHMTQSAISHQLKFLRDNNAVKSRRQGKCIIYSLDDCHVIDILEKGLEHMAHKKVYDEENSD